MRQLGQAITIGGMFSHFQSFSQLKEILMEKNDIKKERNRYTNEKS